MIDASAAAERGRAILDQRQERLRNEARLAAIDRRYGPPKRKIWRTDSPPTAPPGPTFGERQAPLVGTMYRAAGRVKGFTGKMKQNATEIVSGMGRKAITLASHVADSARVRALEAKQAVDLARINARRRALELAYVANPGPRMRVTYGFEGKEGKPSSGHDRLISKRDEIMNRKKQRAIEVGLRMCDLKTFLG